MESASGNEITFKPVTLNRLVDSPVLAGEFYRAVDVTPPDEPIHHEIDMVSDSSAALEMSPELQKKFTNLVAESGKLFGSRHYRDYHFLLTLSEHVAHFGLEHHESNDSRTGERGLLSPQGQRGVGGLLSHEFMHSWNGKFRRPADLATPEYETPMQTDLLWVYEGLTDFLGPLLAARSGLWTAEQYRDNLASIAADLGPGTSGAHLAAAGRYRGRHSRHVWRIRRRGKLEARRGLLCRRRLDLAGGQHDHPAREPREKVHRRTSATFSTAARTTGRN